MQRQSINNSSDQLLNMVKMLSETEYVELYNSIGKHKGAITKIGLLLNAYYNSSNKTVEQIHSQITFVSNGAAVNQLRYRLKKYLVSYISSHSHKYLTKSESFNRRSGLLKDIIEVDLLYSNGHEKTAIKNVKRIYNDNARGLGTPEESMCLDRMIRYAGPSMSTEELVNTMELQEAILNELVISTKSHKTFYKCMQPLFSNKASFHSRKTEIEKTISKLTEIERQTHSPSCRYYLLRILVYYDVQMGVYSSAMKHAQEFLELVVSNKKHNTISNISGATLQIGNIAAYSNNPKDAIIHFESALELFPKKSSNRVRVQNAILSCQLLLGNYSLAMDIINSMESLVRKLGERQIQEWLYRKAYVSHLIGDDKYALSTIASKLRMTSKDVEWFVSCRLLELQCLWSVKEYDVYESKLFALKRTIRQKRMSKRQELIIRLLDVLLSGKRSPDETKDYLELLASSQPSYQWDPYGFEMLRFDNWWLGHVKYKSNVNI